MKLRLRIIYLLLCILSLNPRFHAHDHIKYSLNAALKQVKHDTTRVKLLIGIAHLSMTEQKEILKTSLNNWKGNLEQVDDVTIIGIRI